jgi:hypothetical protein
MSLKRPILLCTLPISLATASLAAAGYVDTQGREWLQVSAFKNKTWMQVQPLCPLDGVTPCSGILSGVDITGYVWATKEQVQELFAEFAPEMSDVETVGGPAYVLSALGFFGSFQPTWEYYTTFGGYNYINGWTSSESDGVAWAPEASAQYPVFDGYFNVAAMVDVNTPSAFRGVWLFKPPVVPCTSDLDASSVVDAADLSILLGAWGTRGANAADLDQSGLVDAGDLAILLGAWGNC